MSPVDGEAGREACEVLGGGRLEGFEELIAAVGEEDALVVDPGEGDVAEVAAEARDAFAEHDFAFAEGLVGAVHAGESPLAGDMDEVPCAREPHPQFVVEGGLKRGVDATGVAVGSGAEEARGLAEDTFAGEGFARERLSGIVAEARAVFVDPGGAAVHGGGIRIELERANGGGDGAGKEEIVGVQPGEDLAAGLGEAGADGIGSAAVLLRDPANASAVGAEEIDGAIGGAAVENGVFDMGVALGENAVDGLREEVRHVEGRRDDGDERPIGGGHLHMLA